jgi:drug/metabolite transporter (DMT)-like permease
MKRRLFILLLLMNVIWAGSYVATKVLMAHAPFYLVTSLRYLIAADPMIAVAWYRPGLKMSLGDFFRCFLIGIATFTFCPVLMYAGVGMSRAADAAILTSTEPLLVSLGAYLYLREKISRRTLFALILAMGGAMLLSEFWKQSGAVNALGALLILAGVFFESWYSVLGKELLRRHAPFTVAAVSIGAACAVNVVALSALGQWGGTAGLTGSDWLLLALYLSTLCTFVGYTVWFVALQTDLASNVAITIFVQPAVGIVVAWIWVNEQPTAAQIIGTIVILLAVSIAVLRPQNVRTPVVRAES